MKKLIYISVGIIAALIISVIIFNKVTGGEKTEYLKVKVEKGEFEILVTTTGELQAENSEDITAPQKLRTSRHLRFGQIKIQDLIPEGTVVEEGEYVATLDRSDALNRLKDIEDELEDSEELHGKPFTVVLAVKDATDDWPASNEVKKYKAA